ncbi:hypothetical protein [Kitasatospora kifunensis]|uniref:Uncharacterized protein n=1 Tax=Kitasatospora kifunensis TaxID=58351 RepID=A0A7W7RAM2_KITKI|nr:hypothetical protein [Kitasatospora kifunensis]MBB4928502.1 hypothetical protein [Kitasatospora kifunensis]
MLDLSRLPVPAEVPFAGAGTAVLTLGLSANERLVILGAIAHLVAGAVYVALTGLTASRVPIRRQEIGAGPGAALAAAGVWAVAVVLWPVPLVCRTLRVLRRRRARSRADQRRPVRSAAPPAVRQADAVTVPPLWFRQEYTAAHAALPVAPFAALNLAAALVERSARAFGDEHPHTLDAWELLAHAARTAPAHLPAGTTLPGQAHSGNVWQGRTGLTRSAVSPVTVLPGGAWGGVR